MKTIKSFFWLIVLALLGILIYQNQSYFMATTALNLDLKVTGWNWTTPEIQNLVYWGICLVLGFSLAGIKGLVTSSGLKKEIKAREDTIASLLGRINVLETELNVFKNDPYIKKAIDSDTNGSE